ncbi:hypothetical protein GYMLUDRAFT_38262 [Collybiopsis luxurians FD-317 M1]|nr:hypothetical protein GYMLUDRAFT_38262 [Collybiopsis luxurians FD-317 M1]
MDGDQSHMFSQSHNFTINGGTFNSIGRSLNISNNFLDQGGNGLLKLYEFSSTSAQYDAEARFPPPLCHPGTREAILTDLKGWVDPNLAQAETRNTRVQAWYDKQVFSEASSYADSALIRDSTGNGNLGPRDNCNVCWLYGPAGAGKSAIAQTLAEICSQRGMLIGSFFFWRTDPSRNNPERLFTTIALQLATSIPGMRSIIDAVITANPSILSSSIEQQFERLVVQPWWKVQLNRQLVQVTCQSGENGKRCARSSSPGPASKRARTSRDAFMETALMSQTNTGILIIDGLDECSGTQNQERILSIFGRAMRDCSFPFRVFIASRPEPRIKEALNGPNFKQNSFRICLEDTYQASRDIRVFLQKEFQRILSRHSDTMEHIPRPWPAAWQIEHLVRKASGQFIFPSTVLRFIDDDCAVPADRLDIVLNLTIPEDESESPFAELDALYRQILSTQKNWKALCLIFGAILSFYHWNHAKSADGRILVELLKADMKSKGALRAALSGVHSLFKGPAPVESDLSLSHASFPDFLLDSRRSTKFCINESDAFNYMAQCCITILNLTQYPKPDADGVFRYSLNNWVGYCLGANCSMQLLSKLKGLNVYTFINFKVKADRILSTSPSMDCHTVSSILINLKQIWVMFQKKYGESCLPNFRDLFTKGFGLKKTNTYSNRKMVTIPIKLSPALFEAGDYQFKACLRSQLSHWNVWGDVCGAEPL